MKKILLANIVIEQDFMRNYFVQEQLISCQYDVIH